ncbi:MAG: ATPase, partial [Actinobacteria bacterium]|nr:ATPase [Actinomycetota bacterium]
AARHGFPIVDFQQRFAEWWRVLLGHLIDAAQSQED